jgi:hypothetical protein
MITKTLEARKQPAGKVEDRAASITNGARWRCDERTHHGLTAHIERQVHDTGMTFLACDRHTIHQLIPPFTVEAKMTAEVPATTTTQRLITATL